MNTFLLLLWYSMIVLFPIAAFIRIPLNGIASMYLYELVMIVWIAIIGLYSRFHYVKPNKHFVSISIVLFLFFCFSLFLSFSHYSPSQNSEAILYFIRIILYTLWILSCIWMYMHTKRFFYHIKKSIVLLTCLVLGIGFIQYFFYPDLRNLLYLGWDPHAYRFFGLFFDLPVSGAVLGSLLLVFLTKNFVNMKLQIGIISLLGIALLLTYARATYLAFVITALYLLLKNRKFIFAFVFVIIFSCSLFLLPRPGGEGINLFRLFSVESRIADYKQGAQIFMKNPIIGIGYNHIRAEKDKITNGLDIGLSESHAGASFHSSFLMILVTGGSIGFALYMGLLLHIMNRFHAVIPIFLFLGIMSLFDNVLLHPIVLWLLPCISMLLVKKQE